MNPQSGSHFTGNTATFPETKRNIKQEAQKPDGLRINHMMHSNGDEFTEDDPLAASRPGEEGHCSACPAGSWQSFNGRRRGLAANQRKSRHRSRPDRIFRSRKSGADPDRRPRSRSRDRAGDSLCLKRNGKRRSRSEIASWQRRSERPVPSVSLAAFQIDAPQLRRLRRRRE